MENLLVGLRERMKMELHLQVSQQQRVTAETIHRKVAEVIVEGCRSLENEMRGAIGLRSGVLAKDSPLRVGVEPMLASLRDKFQVSVLSEPIMREFEETMVNEMPRLIKRALEREMEIMATEVVREAMGRGTPTTG